MKTKVLVTGGAGFIGSHICQALLDANFEVRVFDNFSSGHRENLSECSSNIEVIEGDVRDAAALLSTSREIEFVIHLAALTSVPHSIENPSQTIDTNVLGMLNVFEAALKSGVKRVLVASSCSVYGESSHTPLLESSPTNPLSPYALSKIQAEEIGRYYQSRHGLQNTHFRIFNVYGRRQNPMSEYAAVIPKFITAFIRETRPIIFGTGHQSRDFVYVEDVARAFAVALTRERTLPQVVNLGSGKAYTLLEILSILESVFGKPLPAEFMPQRPGDIFYSCADPSLMRKTLEFVPTISIEEGLRKSAEWLREPKDSVEQLAKRR